MATNDDATLLAALLFHRRQHHRRILGALVRNRLDRGMYTAPLWWGLLIMGVYDVATDVDQLFPVAPAIDFAAALLLAVGALLCVIGQRINDLGTAYRFEFVGLVTIVAALAIPPLGGDYTLLHPERGYLAGVIQIGSIRMATKLAVWLRNDRKANLCPQ